MIAANGFIAFADPDGGFGLPLPCNIQQTKQNLLDTISGEHYIDTAYKVLIERRAAVNEHVKLFDDGGAELGDFAVKSVEVLNFANVTRLCL